MNQKFDLNEFWADEVATATHVCNKVTYAKLSANQTPFELWTARKPDLGQLRVFGSSCRLKGQRGGSG